MVSRRVQSPTVIDETEAVTSDCHAADKVFRRGRVVLGAVNTGKGGFGFHRRTAVVLDTRRRAHAWEIDFIIQLQGRQERSTGSYFEAVPPCGKQFLPALPHQLCLFTLATAALPRSRLQLERHFRDFTAICPSACMSNPVKDISLPG